MIMATRTKLTDEQALERAENFDPQAPGVVVRDGSFMRRIREAAAARDAAQDDVDAAVAEARAAGSTWVEIALALGITPQGARQRYNH